MTEFSKASRLDVFQTGIFAALNEEKERLQREGRKLYNLFIGTPDFKPAPHVMQALCEAAADPENWKYSLTESEELLDAVCSYYRDRFGVTITPDIIMKR